jgi:uncharacterized protein
VHDSVQNLEETYDCFRFVSGPETHPIQREFYDFYPTPRGEFTPNGSSPNLTTHPTLSSNVKFMNFYPFTDIETISPRPMLFITGEISHSREFSEEAYKLAGQPKELVVVPGAGHVDLTGWNSSHSINSRPFSLKI